jgi:hypothetical protein
MGINANEIHEILKNEFGRYLSAMEIMRGIVYHGN